MLGMSSFNLSFVVSVTLHILCNQPTCDVPINKNGCRTTARPATAMISKMHQYSNSAYGYMIPDIYKARSLSVQSDQCDGFWNIY